MLVGLLVGALGGIPPALAKPSSDPPWLFLYSPCQDSAVKPLEGLTRDAAMDKVKRMNLHSFRLLNWRTVTDFAVEPGRLTMVVGDNGVILRAFCR